jgi:hypothetical protein
MDQNKFYCECCKFGCDYISQYNQHLETEKHKNNGIGIRKKKELKKCDRCNFTTNKTTNINVHRLTKHGTPEEREKGFTYYCKKCDFGTFTKILYERHCESSKHQN